MRRTSSDLVPELAVSDIAASLSFYVGVLGFKVRYQRPDEGFAYLHLGKADLMLDQINLGRDFDAGSGPILRPFGRGVNLQIRVAAIAPLLKALATRDIAPFLPPEDRWYRKDQTEVGNRQFIVADPDGYLLRFFQDLGARPLAGD